MSLTTRFPFRDFECDTNRQRDVLKEALATSLHTPTDVQALGFVKVSIPAGRENDDPTKPVVKSGVELATFYDTRMGNFDVKGFPRKACTACCPPKGKATTNQRCNGHFGYIDLPRLPSGDRVPVFNPLLVDDMVRLISSQCIHCHHLRISASEEGRLLKAYQSLQDGNPELAQLIIQQSAEKSSANKRTRDPYDEDGDAEAALTNPAFKAAEHVAVNKALPPTRCPPEMVEAVTAHVWRSVRNAGGKCSRCNLPSPSIRYKRNQLWYTFTDKDWKVVESQATGADLQRLINDRKLAGDRKRAVYRVQHVKTAMQMLFHYHTDLMANMFPYLGSPSIEVPNQRVLHPAERYQLFFVDRMLVPPLPVRTASGLRLEGRRLQPDGATRILSSIIQAAIQIEAFYDAVSKRQHQATQVLDNESNIAVLQEKVNEYVDQVISKFSKKTGLFRMNMMGKRVNQACRSVISPDYMLEPNQLFLPRAFARSLSFPEELSLHWQPRLDLLTRAIINGPETYPGASHIEIISGGAGNRVVIELDGTSQVFREKKAEEAVTAARRGNVVQVHRHVVDGDRVIFNRQPTLHRPSMMGFVVKVASNEKTIRFHYVNSKSFNADFDGDEMNVHVPQSMDCKAELDMIMDANLNYLVPTSGRPIRGLIQDHIVGGLLMTRRNAFFSRDQVLRLVVEALGPYDKGFDWDAILPPPTILFPVAMWTGKQIVSVILCFVTKTREGNHGLTMASNTFIPRTELGEDSTIVVRRSQLLSGVLDKASLGQANLSICHAVYEIYGPVPVAQFIAGLGRAITTYVRTSGFSIGIDDMLLSISRAQFVREVDACADIPAISKVVSKGDRDLPKKLRFPENQLLAMTKSGAKGSGLNAQQMAVILGQQLLEGNKVPPMASGKTLPGFFQNDARARAGGCALGCFLTGIRPQDYTIHSICGRDSLVDTAIKTARSGHLQRCLIKGLESVQIRWDGTVRDSSETIIQFAYGGDGLDPCKSSTMCHPPGRLLQLNNSEDMEARYMSGLDSEAVHRMSESWRDTTFQAYQAIKAMHKGEIAKELDTRQCRSTPKDLSAERRKNALLMASRVSHAGCDVGEAVGIQAAQAAGEPSTQMTLNTFHSAGSSVSHVTEGIPRLRELLMFASVSKPVTIVKFPKTYAQSQRLTLERRLKEVATPRFIKDYLKDDGCYWTIRRDGNHAQLAVVLDFDGTQLREALEAMALIDSEQVTAFRSGMRSFANLLCKSMLLRDGQRATSAGGADHPMFDPDEGAVGGGDGDDEGDDDLASDDGQEEDNAAENESDDGGSEDDDDEDDGLDSESDSQSEEDEGNVPQRRRDQSASLNNMNPVSGSLGSGKVSFSVEALPRTDVRVCIEVSYPSSVITVVDDLLTKVLKKAYFPSPYPMVDDVFCAGQDNAELFFQGEGATLVNVAQLLTLFGPEDERLLNNMYSTDVRDMCNTFGVTAGRELLFRELCKLFAKYDVNRRHMSLIGDVAMHHGVWEGYNYNGIIKRAASPLFQMTFSATKVFLHKAYSRGIADDLKSMSASIMLGEQPKVGTAVAGVVVKNVFERN